MGLFSFLSAVVTRVLFILVSLVAVWRVTWVKENPTYWLLTLLFLPLVAEMIITLMKRKGLDYKWFSPTIFLFLISIIPSIWILEIDYQHYKKMDDQCKPQDALARLQAAFLNETSRNNTAYDKLKTGFGNVAFSKVIVEDLFVYPFYSGCPRDELHARFDGGEVDCRTFSENVTFLICPLSLHDVVSHFCENNWILALHQILLILLIIGKWLLPLGGGVTRDQLSQLLLIFVGTAADILEFTSETLDQVKEDSPQLVYITLAVWTWSMLQFPCHLSVVGSMNDEAVDESIGGNSLWSKHNTDLWSIAETLFIHDGPFLIVRLTVMIHFRVVQQMLFFFAFKNFLVVILNVYRLSVLYQDFKSSGHSPVRD